jgi:hypothetical protein
VTRCGTGTESDGPYSLVTLARHGVASTTSCVEVRGSNRNSGNDSITIGGIGPLVSNAWRQRRAVRGTPFTTGLSRSAP